MRHSLSLLFCCLFFSCNKAPVADVPEHKVATNDTVQGIPSIHALVPGTYSGYIVYTYHWPQNPPPNDTLFNSTLEFSYVLTDSMRVVISCADSNIHYDWYAPITFADSTHGPYTLAGAPLHCMMQEVRFDSLTNQITFNRQSTCGYGSSTKFYGTK